MNWYLSSLIAAFAFTGMFFCFQRLQKTYPIDVYLFYTWLGSAIFFGIVYLRSGVDLTLDLVVILIVAGIASWLGNYAYNVGISKQPNLGYVEVASSIRLVIVYAVSLVSFGAKIEAIRLIAIIGVVTGILLVTGSNASGSKPVNKGWLSWTVFAGIMFALLIIANRFVNGRGMEPPVALFFWLLIAAILYGGSAIAKGNTLKPSGDIGTLVLATLAAIVGNATLFEAYSITPNLAYPTTINNSRMVLLYLISVLVQHKKLEIKGALGVLLTFVSVVLLI
jgi:uncharacterized membrane protein